VRLRLGALAILVASVVHAQVREQVTVELIEIPVYVIGSNGQPIRGLAKDAFELRVNGRRQPIEYFDAIDFAAPAPTQRDTNAPIRRAARERRLYLLLFDAAYSVSGSLARAQRAAHYAVDHSNEETDVFAVATYTTNKGVQFASAFIPDRVAIHRAIQTLSTSAARDPLTIAMSAAERSQWASEMSSAGGRREGNLEETIVGGDANREMLEQPAKNRITDLLANFGDMATRLSGLEGQKHVLYFSTGFAAELCYPGFQPDPRCMRTLQEMFSSFRAAGVFIDSIDIAGLRTNWDATTHATKVRETDALGRPLAIAQLRSALDVNDSLRTVAAGTGGEFVHNRNDLGSALTDLTNGQKVVYIVGFNRRGSGSGWVSVRVNGVPPGTRVTHRLGFGAASRRTDVDPLQLADILINDVPQSGLTLPIRAADNDVEVMIPIQEVRAQIVEKTPYVDVLLYVFDERGAAVEGMQKRIRFDETLKRANRPIVVRKHLDLPPGNYVAKAIARIEGTTSLGFARTDVTVK
jgi:VWFA-related protein